MSSSKQLVALIGVIAVLALTRTTSAQNSPDDFVNGHNAARSAVGVGPVSWNDTVAAYAEDYANQRSGDCKLISSNSTLYGENIHVEFNRTDVTAQDAIDSWVSHEQYYDYGNNTCVPGKENDCLVYEQVVWANSTSIGCARVVCDKDVGVFINCNYYPPGNVPGERPY